MLYQGLFDYMQQIRERPKAFEIYTTDELWTDPYISQKMLQLHLNPESELASRNRSFIDESANWIKSHFLLDTETKICDFGCGPGLYTTRFAKTCAKVIGIDFSKTSITYAKKQAIEDQLKIDYILQDYLSFQTNEHFDLVTMIYCDFCVLSPSQRTALLNKFRDLLSENGRILLDVHSMRKFDLTTNKMQLDYCQGDGFWSAQEHYSILSTTKYNDEKVILDKWTILEKNRTRQIFNWLQCYTLSTLAEEFSSAGLEIIECFADVCGSPLSPTAEEIAVIARKRSGD